MTDPSLPPSGTQMEGRLRTLLADRAETVIGPPPALPHCSADDAVPVTSIRGDHRGRRWRSAAVAAAAAVALAAVGLIAVLRDQGGDDDRVLTTEPASATSGLPADFDPATAGGVMRISADRDPEVAARRYLRWRLTEPGADADEVVEGLRFDAGERAGAVVPVTWRRGDGTLGGTVIVRVGERGSDIVASTAPGVDLSSVHMDGDRVVGHVETSGPAVPGRARVDVLFAGTAFPRPVDGVPGAPLVRGYGSAAKGEAEFDVTVGPYDPIVSARFVEGGAVRAIAELAPRAPRRTDIGQDPSTMTAEELFQDLAPASPDPRCTALIDDPGPTANASPTASPEPTDAAVLGPALAPSPEAAVDALATAMGVDATDLTVTSPLSSGGVVGAWFDDAPVEILVQEHDGGFDATEATTADACWNAGTGTGSEPGAPPRTQLSFSRVADARTGRLWYRTVDGTTSTVALDADDLARGNVTVVGERGRVEALAVVARDEGGDVVVVQRTNL